MKKKKERLVTLIERDKYRKPKRDAAKKQRDPVTIEKVPKAELAIRIDRIVAEVYSLQRLLPQLSEEQKSNLWNSCAALVGGISKERAAGRPERRAMYDPPKT